MSDNKFPEGFAPVSPDSNFGKMMEKFKGIDMSSFGATSYNLSNNISSQFEVQEREIERSLQAVQRERERKEAAEAAYREETIRSLRAIEQNTANLYTLVDLISKSNEQQDELIEIIAEVLTIAKAKNQAEAKSVYTKVMGRIQLPEPCADGTDSAQAGFTNICEIGKERIRRAGDKIKAEAGLTAQNLDIGFRVLKLDDTNMNDVYYAAGDYTQDLILQMESNIKPDRTDMDLL